MLAWELGRKRNCDQRALGVGARFCTRTFGGGRIHEISTRHLLAGRLADAGIPQATRARPPAPAASLDLDVPSPAVFHPSDAAPPSFFTSLTGRADDRKLLFGGPRGGSGDGDSGPGGGGGDGAGSADDDFTREQEERDWRGG
uniref:Uncharacterized protein n=1 Tax=Setaria viridis TaxID=4556 RepID=A0A4U6UF04_SETVI|nr:hypothetical protein SEVIR_5G099050v2 [Setaria viridis]